MSYNKYRKTKRDDRGEIELFVSLFKKNCPKKMETFKSGRLNNEYESLRQKYENDLPWVGKKQKIEFPLEACASAHAWLKLKSENKNPNDYTMVVHDGFFQRQNPCPNCSQWVSDNFSKVIDEGIENISSLRR